MAPWWKSFPFRFGAVYTIVVTAIGVAAIFALSGRDEREAADKLGRVVESIASTTAPFVTGADLDRIQREADARGEAFQRVEAILRQVQRQNGLDKDRIFVLRRKDPLYEFVVMLQERTFVGDLYKPPAALMELYGKIEQDKKTMRSPLYRDDKGTFVSGVAPILRYDGSVAGLLHVDHDMDGAIASVSTQRALYLVGLFLFVAALSAAGLWMSRQETAAAAAAKAVEARAAPVGARTADVALLCSDLRRFERPSDPPAPHAALAAASDLLRAQAELIAAATGWVTGSMGDVTLAIFEGRDKERRAVECALAIQDAAARLNVARPIDAQLLVAMSVGAGDVVIDAGGVSGPPVSLAMRLCSQAHGGEVIVSAQVRALLDQAIGLRFTDEEQLKIRGFEGTVACHRATGQSMHPVET